MEFKYLFMESQLLLSAQVLVMGWKSYLCMLWQDQAGHPCHWPQATGSVLITFPQPRKYHLESAVLGGNVH